MGHPADVADAKGPLSRVGYRSPRHLDYRCEWPDIFVSPGSFPRLSESGMLGTVTSATRSVSVVAAQISSNSIAAPPLVWRITVPGQRPRRTRLPTFGGQSILM